MDVVDANERDMGKEPMGRIYCDFRDGEGIPVHQQFYIENVNALETAPWHRTGQEGAFVNLYGTEGINDLQLHQLAPGGETETVHTFYDEIVYVTQGRGLARVGAGADAVQFEFDEESMFYLPYNVPYKYVNLSDEPTRLLAQTALPILSDLLQDMDFFLDPPEDAVIEPIDQTFFSDEGTEGNMFKQRAASTKYEAPMSWRTNFVPSVSSFDKLRAWSKLGAMKAVFLQFPKTGMYAHISEFDPGQYKIAHRHHPGAHLFIRAGEGYSLMWEDDADEVLRADWEENSVFVPPAHWWHHHFNLSDEAVRQVVMHSPKYGTLKTNSVFDTFSPKNRVEYVDENPEIRELYQRELDARDLEFRMPAACYEDPEFTFS